jgi:hypothetical protein
MTWSHNTPFFLFGTSEMMRLKRRLTYSPVFIGSSGMKQVFFVRVGLILGRTKVKMAAAFRLSAPLAIQNNTIFFPDPGGLRRDVDGAHCSCILYTNCL